MLAEGEKNEMITRAAFLLREGKPKEADALWSRFTRHLSVQPRCGLGLSWDGDWLASSKSGGKPRAGMLSSSTSTNSISGAAVGLDYQAYAVLLVETGEFSTYARFCRASATRYAGESNGDAACRILKSCLLRPPDEN